MASASHAIQAKTRYAAERMWWVGTWAIIVVWPACSGTPSAIAETPDPEIAGAVATLQDGGTLVIGPDRSTRR